MRKKKEGVLRKDVDTKVPSLMAKYDPQGNGTLSMPEFLQLQRDIIDTSTLDPGARRRRRRCRRCRSRSHTATQPHNRTAAAARGPCLSAADLPPPALLQLSPSLESLLVLTRACRARAGSR